MRIEAMFAVALLSFAPGLLAQDGSGDVIRRLMENFESQLSSGRAIGTMEAVIQLEPDSEPQVAIDAVVQVTFNRPRFLVDLQYNRCFRMESPNAPRPMQRPNDERRLEDTGIIRRQLLCDGNKIYCVETRADGRIDGEIRLASHLRTVQFQFETGIPENLFCLVALPIDIEQIKRDRICPLPFMRDDRAIWRNQAGDHDHRMYFVGSEDFQLRRVVLKIPSMVLPLEEADLHWSSDGDAFFVSRYVREARLPLHYHEFAVAAPFMQKTSFEFVEFEANSDIPDSVFSIASLGAPDGTKFKHLAIERRKVPNVYELRGAELVLKNED